MKKLLWTGFMALSLGAIFLGIAHAVVTLNTTDLQSCDGREAVVISFQCQVVYSDAAMEVVNNSLTVCSSTYIKKPLTGAVPAPCKAKTYMSGLITGTQLQSYTTTGINMGVAMFRLAENLVKRTENNVLSD